MEKMFTAVMLWNAVYMAEVYIDEEKNVVVKINAGDLAERIYDRLVKYGEAFLEADECDDKRLEKMDRITWKIFDIMEELSGGTV